LKKLVTTFLWPVLEMIISALFIYWLFLFLFEVNRKESNPNDFALVITIGSISKN